MKIIILLLIMFFMIKNCLTQELTLTEKTILEKLDKNYPTMSTTSSLNYAWLLYRTENQANFLKADTVINQVIALQDNDPESITFGQWDWKWQKGEKVVDFNKALFKANIMLCKLWEQQSKMSPETRVNFTISCKQLVEAAIRRWDTEIFDIGRDFVAYSNIFVSYIETLILASERFTSERLKKMAKSQWTRWYNHVSFFGIDEFASPSYNNMIFNSLKNIYVYCHDERIQKETLEVLDHIYLLQSALTHPLLRIVVSGISRDYREFLIQEDARSGVLISQQEWYNPPNKAVEINKKRNYPFEVIGKAAINPFIFKSYQLKDAAMGSMTGGNCFQQQIHCLVAVGKEAKERAVVFIQGSYTPINGFTDQLGTSTLCVYNRLPNYWHLTQWRKDMSRYKETFEEFGIGISANWQEKENSPNHIIIEAFGYDLYLFPFVIENENIVQCTLALKHRTTTSSRYHPRSRIFNEYVFPRQPDWFGVFIALVKSGIKVTNPNIVYSNNDGIRTFKTDFGHKIRLFIAEKGDTKQLFNVDPALIPILKIYE